MANEFVTLTPYDEQLEKLRRRQRMADLLQQQAMEPLESQVAPGGYVVPTSPLLGLAKMLQAYMGGREQSNIDKELAGIREETTDAMRGITGRMFGERPTQYDKMGLPIGREPYTPPDLTPDEMGNTPRAPKPIALQPGQAESGSRNRSFAQSISEGDQLGEITPTAKYQYDPSGAMQMAMTPAGARAMQGNPMLASMLAQMVKPKEPEKFGTTPVQGADGNFYLVSESGRMVKTPVAGQVKTPEEPSSVREYKIAVGQGYKGSLMDFLTERQRAGATNVNVDTKAGNELANVFVNQLGDLNKQALGATKIHASLSNLERLTKEGTYTGAMAPNAIGASEFLQSFGINVNPETLANSQEFNAVKNNLLLQFMSANGGARGFTEKESAMLNEAFPQIVNSSAARKQIIDVLRSNADTTINQYNDQLNNFKRAYPTAVIPYQPIETEEMRYRRWKASQPGGQ